MKDKVANTNMKLLDAANKIAAQTDLSELLDEAYNLAYCDCESLSPEDIEYLRKRKRYEEVIEMICHFNGELEIEIDPSFQFDDIRMENRTWNLLHTDGDGIFSQLSIDVMDNFTRLVHSNEELLMGIKDRKFQHYLQIRKNLNLLKIKLNNSKPKIYAYGITTINTILEKVDMYLLSYITNILLLANCKDLKELILNFQKNLNK